MMNELYAVIILKCCRSTKPLTNPARAARFKPSAKSCMMKRGCRGQAHPTRGASYLQRTCPLSSANDLHCLIPPAFICSGCRSADLKPPLHHIAAHLLRRISGTCMYVFLSFVRSFFFSDFWQEVLLRFYTQMRLIT